MIIPVPSLFFENNALPLRVFQKQYRKHKDDRLINAKGKPYDVGPENLRQEHNDEDA